jgi:hypothetical protein
MVYQDYELIPSKRVNHQRRGTFSIFFNRVFNAAGGYSSVYFGSVVAYAYMLKIAQGPFNKYLIGAPVFATGFVAGTFLFGDSKEFFHLLRQYPTYRREFKMIKNELYYS